MLRVSIITFSPAGSTRKVGAMLAAALDDHGCDPQLVDITRNPAYFGGRNPREALEGLVRPHDVLCIGGPVYAHHMQFNVLDLVRRLPPVDARWGRLAVPFVTYGGLTSGRALYDTARGLRRSGRRVVLAMKINAFHSVTREFATRINEGMPGQEAWPLIDELAALITQLRPGSPPADVTRLLNYQDAKNRVKKPILAGGRGRGLLPSHEMPRSAVYAA